MPKLGLTMEEGSIIRWLKSEGEQVTKDETILEIETDKVVAEVEAPATGFLGTILFGEGETVPVGQVVAHVLDPGEKAPQLLQAEAKSSPTQTLDKPQTPQPRQASQRVAASPATRRLAKELTIDLNSLSGTGPGGRITQKDVRRAAETTRADAGPPSPTQVISDQSRIRFPQGVRKVTAERLTHSFSTSPHFYLSVEADAGLLLEMRERFLPLVEEKANVRLTISDLLVKITAQALRECPEVNAVWEDGHIRDLKTIDIGLAVATGRGLMVPVLRQADVLSLSDLAALRKRLVDGARAGKLGLEDLEGGSLTISNLGTFAVDQFNAIINPPQAAILAVGQIKGRPVAIGNEVCVRQTVFLTLSVDHRILDGAEAARFLDRLVTLVERPYLLLQI
jgi:pyruvate dehydrogenase E2 component (dihydrolipoamide acetyltransferase)